MTVGKGGVMYIYIQDYVDGRTRSAGKQGRRGGVALAVVSRQSVRASSLTVSHLHSLTHSLTHSASFHSPTASTQPHTDPTHQRNVHSRLDGWMDMYGGPTEIDLGHPSMHACTTSVMWSAAGRDEMAAWVETR